MEKVIFQPSGSPDAARHFRDTVETPVTIDSLAKHFDAVTISKLRDIYPAGVVPVWGVVPGDRDRNIKKWNRVDVGDIVLFTGRKKAFASAVVTAKARSVTAAIELWGTDDEGATWEYMYFLDEVTRQDIAYKTLNAAAGYEETNNFQQFVVADNDKSEGVLAAFKLASSTHYAPTTEKDFLDNIKNVDAETLDTERMVSARTEQGFLRKLLFGGSVSSECCLCGESFPVEFLVASHIKKRCLCSDEEKRDATNIVAPMCCFGCDDLYERGYVGVVDGVITQLKPAPNSPPVQRKVATIIGRKCSRWGDGTKKYFRWHSKHHAPVKNVP